jgi:hypothetical protein
MRREVDLFGLLLQRLAHWFRHLDRAPRLRGLDLTLAVATAVGLTDVDKPNGQVGVLALQSEGFTGRMPVPSATVTSSRSRPLQETKRGCLGPQCVSGSDIRVC